MKVWIHINGSQEGPYELDSLPMDRINAATPVWYQGLPDWMAAGQAPLTAPLFGMQPDSAAMADAHERAQRKQSQGLSHTESEIGHAEASAEERQASENTQGYTYGAALRRAQTATPRHTSETADEEKCPATYLGWSIALTILCCNPIGIGAIMTGATTRSKFNSRDYEGARKMSETTAWWFMITIVTCLMFLPFTLLLS